MLQDSDLFFNLNQKSEEEVKYIAKESEYFSRCVIAEENAEKYEGENKQLSSQVQELKYQVAKLKVEGQKKDEEKEALKKELEALKKELAALKK